MFLFLTVPLLPHDLEAKVDGISSTNFNLTAKGGYISTAEGNSLYAWGYANGAGTMQYPGVTMIVNQGDTVTVTLTNELTVPVSILFPGQDNVTSSGGSQGLLTAEALPTTAAALPEETVTYSFVAANAGTYMYHSGTNPALQIEMGLVGAIIVRPYGFDINTPTAYDHPDTDYEYETLFLLTEMDSRIHDLVESQGVGALSWYGLPVKLFPELLVHKRPHGPGYLIRPVCRMASDAAV